MLRHSLSKPLFPLASLEGLRRRTAGYDECEHLGSAGRSSREPMEEATDPLPACRLLSLIRCPRSEPFFTRPKLPDTFSPRLSLYRAPLMRGARCLRRLFGSSLDTSRTHSLSGKTRQTSRGTPGTSRSQHPATRDTDQVPLQRCLLHRRLRTIQGTVRLGARGSRDKRFGRLSMSDHDIRFLPITDVRGYPRDIIRLSDPLHGFRSRRTLGHRPLHNPQQSYGHGWLPAVPALGRL